MSGFVGLGFSASPGAALEAAFGGGLLTLGDLVFTDWSLPESISTGGQQQTTIHKLPGGARVIDTMGPDPTAISWSGLFTILGIATQMRQQLEAIRDAGDPVDLTWGDQSYNVIVTRADFGEEHVGRRITYQVTCEVVPDAPDDDSDTDESDMGDQQPDTPAAAKDAGTRQVSRARSAAASIPVPPVPPPSSSTFIGG